MSLHMFMMATLWLFTCVYGGIVIYRTLSPELARIQQRIAFQPELALALGRKCRLIQGGMVLTTILWCIILTLTCLAILSESPATCSLYLC